jgi:predicted dehydrogenase
MSTRPPVKIVLVGCGAIAELFYLPVLAELQSNGEAELAAFFDPDQGRHSAFKKMFPGATPATDWQVLLATKAGLAIVASPQKFHASQTVDLLEHGFSVLCEKPMAATVAEAEAMIAAANRAGKLLAVGLFRRFFPSSRTVREIILNRRLGLVRKFEISEGAPFNWPAHSASFFQKSGSAGGVLTDTGIHVLDLLLWWFGDPSAFSYADDAMGGLEANCRIALEFPGGVSGTVRLSRDTLLPNRTVIECEQGWLRLGAADADRVEIGFHGFPFATGGVLSENGNKNPYIAQVRPADTYAQSFVRQLKNVIEAVCDGGSPFISGQDGIQSLRFVEQCYRQRTLIPMPWLEEREMARARALNAEVNL